MRKTLGGLFLLIPIIIFASCAQLEESPPEELNSIGQPCSAGQPWQIVKVFYGTDRVRQSAADWNHYYGNEHGELSLGICEVSIPDTHQYGEIERPSIWQLEFKESPEKHIMLQSIKEQSADEFVQMLQSDVQRSAAQEAFIFVHGYNVSFAAAARRTAQMAFDLNFSGPPILFSWPSRGELSGYVADMTAADQARDHLQLFIQQIAMQSGARKIHLIAHSMGNRLVCDTLKRYGEIQAYTAVPRLNEIILAAPDVDARTFKEMIAPKINGIGDRVTIYASSNDRALQASQFLHQQSRLGQGGSHLTTFPEFSHIEVIDASWIDFSFFDLGHAEYGDALLVDVKQTLTGQPAERRGLEPLDLASAWLFPQQDAADEVTKAIQTVSHEVEQAVEEVEQIDDKAKAGGWFFLNWLTSLWK